MASDRCTYFTKSYDQRMYEFTVRQAATRTALLKSIREVNHASVHPMNHNFITDTWTDRDIYLWALFNELLTPHERDLLAFV